MGKKIKKIRFESSCNFPNFTGIYDYLKICGGVVNGETGIE